MTRIESLKIIEEEFTQAAQAYIREYYTNKLEDDIEATHYLLNDYLE
jgi:hypothetical protein